MQMVNKGVDILLYGSIRSMPVRRTVINNIHISNYKSTDDIFYIFGKLL